MPLGMTFDVGFIALFSETCNQAICLIKLIDVFNMNDNQEGVELSLISASIKLDSNINTSNQFYCNF